MLAVTSASFHSVPLPSECQILVLVSFPFISTNVKKGPRAVKGRKSGSKQPRKGFLVPQRDGPIPSSW